MARALSIPTIRIRIKSKITIKSKSKSKSKSKRKRKKNACTLRIDKACGWRPAPAAAKGLAALP